ncbi:MAG: DUF4878 domain-containing protein [Candidatus Aegiribacteria sp.]|nr:DUF4878 domain-containing protein [Candidatus Aegiribacteria sp.]
MRKILAVLGVVGLAVMACGGGGGASTPEDAVNGAFNAMKSGDIDAMAQYVPEADRSEITDMSDEDKEMMQGMLSLMSAMEFKVIGSEIDGETAIVTMEMTFMGETDESEVELMLENGSWVITSGGMF